MSRNEQTWRQAAAELEKADQELHADARFMEALRRYVAELVAWGGSIHLTGSVRRAEAIGKQICDSAAMLRCAEEAMQALGGAGAARVADIGAGAGFPGIIWKLARPGWELALIERRERIASFLRRTVVVLGLEDVEVVERDARMLETGCYDIVVSKASGRFSSILPIAERIGRAGSLYVTAKGGSWEAELADAGAVGYERAAIRPMRDGRGIAIALRRRST